MIKNVAIVSLSSGVLGELFIQHALEIGIRRLEAYDLSVTIMDNSVKGIDYINKHPEKRADDLLQVFADGNIDMIICAVGGDDTYRLLPYLFDHDELRKVTSNKIFLGFSDTTMNHLMLHKVGVNTVYGQAFLPDICELDNEMLPYTRQYFEELITTGTISKIEPSNVWYDGRTSFDVAAIGTSMPQHKNEGFELLQGIGKFSGEILGGCIDTLYDIFNNGRYSDSVQMCKQYEIFPSLEDWSGKILLLETSEEKATPGKYKKMLQALKETGLFKVIHGIIVGKPMDEKYANEYKDVLIEVVNDPSLSIVCNINVGHATPRCIVPFGVFATVDVDRQVITFGSVRNIMETSEVR